MTSFKDIKLLPSFTFKGLMFVALVVDCACAVSIKATSNTLLNIFISPLLVNQNFQNFLCTAICAVAVTFKGHCTKTILSTQTLVDNFLF
jgi:hypothetical protein